jgi:hypothetical protein
MKSTTIWRLIMVCLILVGASCRKKYTCRCTTTYGTSGVVGKTIDYELEKQYRDDAIDFCERYEDDLNKYDDSSTTGCSI